LVSDIPAGDGKIENLFLQCRSFLSSQISVCDLQLRGPDQDFFFICLYYFSLVIRGTGERGEMERVLGKWVEEK
jgi:hypothetical protein